MLTENQKKDLEDKKNMLTNILDLNDKKDIEVVNVMLLKGRGYRAKDLEDGKVEKILGYKDDFHYRCEIGKMIDIYLPTFSHYNVAQPDILKIARKLSAQQLEICADNIKQKLKIAMNVIEKDEKNEIKQVPQDFKDEVINQIKKCDEVLHYKKN